jgi:hypothetical protein
LQNRKYYFLVIGITAAFAAAVYYPATTWLKPGALPYIYVAIALASISSILAFTIVSGGLAKRIEMFTTYIIGSMLAKMMVGILSITIIALKFKDFSTEYVLSYFFCYFIFTGFEVYALMRKLRPISEKGTRSTHDENASN